MEVVSVYNSRKKWDQRSSFGGGGETDHNNITIIIIKLGIRILRTQKIKRSAYNP